MFQKEKRKGCCTYSWPVSVPCLWTSWCQSLGVGLFGFFLGSFFLLFVFSLSFFSGFLNPNALSLQHCQSGHLRTCAQPEICRQQVPEKVWDDLSLWYEPDLVNMRGSWTSPFVSEFQTMTALRKAGHAAKNVQRCCSLGFSRVVYLTREKTL